MHDNNTSAQSWRPHGCAIGSQEITAKGFRLLICHAPTVPASKHAEDPRISHVRRVSYMEIPKKARAKEIGFSQTQGANDESP